MCLLLLFFKRLFFKFSVICQNENSLLFFFESFQLTHQFAGLSLAPKLINSGHLPHTSLDLDTSTCLHILPDFTESEYPLWFRIALRSSVFMVKSVKLNYLSSSSNIFNIFVWEMWWQEYEPQHLCYSGNLLNNTELTCSSPMIGKYVTVASNSSNTAVYICEIEVYGIGMWKTFENYKQIQIQALQAYFW